MPTGIYHRKLSSPLELFEKKVLRTDSCWIWKGSITAGGYGTVGIGGRKGKKVYAHRLSYELFVGEIPAGLELDHLCRNRRCVNPKHLEPVTRQVNTIRGVGPKMLGNINKSKTHCSKGHEFNEENTYFRPSGGRACRICQKNYRNKY